VVNNKNLHKNAILKSKLTQLKRLAGRNHSGKITSYHKGGGHKRRYREINFFRNTNSIGLITTIEYDPNRSANIASVYNIEKENNFYILAPLGLTVGDIVKSGEKLIEQRLGYSSPLEEIAIGSVIHNISLQKSGPAKLVRSAGNYAIILDKSLGRCLIQLNSGKKISISTNCYATLGIVSNDLHILSTLNKAGKSRWCNKRPHVRGVAMNPIDHPNGGGEGKKSGRGYSPWGKPKKRKKHEPVKMERSLR